MKLNKEAMRLYLVTDRHWLKDETLSEQVEQAIQEGVSFIQIREKQLSVADFIEEAKAIKKVTDQYGVPFVVNDNIEVALAVNADGVHVGQNDLNPKAVRALLGDEKIIGVSARTVEQALKAQAEGADYIGVGAVFGTSTKKDAQPLSHEVLKEITQAVSIPVVAIGGINEENILQLKGTGIDGVAVVSAILGADHVAQAASQMRKLAEAL